jgi:AcrR family transcriptional regulator
METVAYNISSVRSKTELVLENGLDFMGAKEIITRHESRNKRAADRQRRRAERRRAQILQAAMRVFESKGYERATTKEIAAEADVSEGVLYYYFEGKRDLLFHLAHAYNESIIAELEELKEADVNEFLRKALLNRFSEVEAQRQFLNTVMHEVQLDADLWRDYHDNVLDRFITCIEELLNEAVEEELFRPMHTGIVARAIIAMVKGLIAFRMAESSALVDVSTEEFADEIVSLLLDGLRRRKESQPS